MISPLKKKLQRLEDEIIAIETQIEMLNDQLITLAQEGNSFDIQKVSKELDALNITLETLYDDLEIDSEKLENEEAVLLLKQQNLQS